MERHFNALFLHFSQRILLAFIPLREEDKIKSINSPQKTITERVNTREGHSDRARKRCTMQQSNSGGDDLGGENQGLRQRDDIKQPARQ